MKHYYLRAALASLVVLPLCGCIDTNYNLDDIDTTSEFKVTDLTIPLNIKPIVLNNVIDINENDPDAAVIIDRSNPNMPVYAIRKSGSFNAQATNIAQVKAVAPTIDGTHQVVKGDLIDYLIPDLPIDIVGPIPAIKFTVKEDRTTFNYDLSGVDQAIKSVEDITLENNSKQKTTFSISVRTSGISNMVENIYLEDIKFLLPADLKVEVPQGTTLSSDNILSIPTMIADASNNFNPSLELTVTGIAFSPAKQVIDGKFEIHEEIGILSANIVAVPKSSINVNDIPRQVDFYADYKIGDLAVESFTGGIEYPVDINNIPSINLSDLPDFLNQQGTNIRLSEPRLSLTVNNPVGKYNVGCEAGLTITPGREAGIPQGNPAVLDKFEIGHDGNGPYTINIDANATSDKVEGYTYTYAFPGLKDVLAGDGLPTSLDIELKSPQIPQPVIKGDAKGFPLGTPIDQVDGTYDFYTPFALADGSTIVYTYTDKNWDDKDLQKLQVNKLTLTATATTDIPMEVTMSCTLLGKDANGQSVELPKKESVLKIPAMAQDAEIELIMEPNDPNAPFERLDGIIFTAVASQNGASGSLSPNQTLKLDNIRITVTGAYTLDF